MRSAHVHAAKYYGFRFKFDSEETDGPDSDSAQGCVTLDGMLDASVLYLSKTENPATGATTSVDLGIRHTF